MKYISKILLIVCISLLGQHAAAQPPKRKKEAAAKEATAVNIPMTDRAKAQYPTNATPDEVAWKRDVYRTLDLKKEKNASLYYPVEPQGDNMRQQKKKEAERGYRHKCTVCGRTDTSHPDLEFRYCSRCTDPHKLQD